MQRRFSTWVFWSIYSKITAIATASGQNRFKPLVFKGLRIGKSKIADVAGVFGKPADDYDDKRGTIWMHYKDTGPAPVWWRSQWTRGTSWFGMSLFIQRVSLATAEALLGPDFRTVRYLFKLPACPDPSCGKSFETGFDVPW
jgi:hypothetical protein